MGYWACAKGKDALRQRKSYRMISINITDARFVPDAGYARFFKISPSALKIPRLEDWKIPYDLFTICAMRRSLDYKQVLFCFVLETGIHRTLTSNPDRGHGSIPTGSWESSCSSEKHLNSYEADDDRVWDEEEGTRGGGGGTPKKKTGILFVSLL